MQDKEYLKALDEAAARVLAGEVTGRDTEVHGTPITAFDFGWMMFLCGRAE